MDDEHDYEQTIVFEGLPAEDYTPQYLYRMLTQRNTIADSIPAVEVHQEMIEYEAALELHFAETAFLNLLLDWKGSPDTLAKKCWGIGKAMVSEGLKRIEEKESKAPSLPGNSVPEPESI